MSRYEVVTILRKGLSHGAIRSVVKGISKDVVQSKGFLRNIYPLHERSLPVEGVHQPLTPGFDGTKVSFDFVITEDDLNPLLEKIHCNAHVAEKSTIHYPNTLDLSDEYLSQLKEAAVEYVKVMMPGDSTSEALRETSMCKEVLSEVLNGDLEVPPFPEEENVESTAGESQ